MNKTLKMVRDKDWRNCPHCNSAVVSAVENAFPIGIGGVSTDLMLCYICQELYIVEPGGRWKGRPRVWPFDIEVDICDRNIEEKEDMLRHYRENRALFDNLPEEIPGTDQQIGRVLLPRLAAGNLRLLS